ncbi:xylulokinase [Chitinophaga pinensis]|uniref:Carbohydrate kinase FGGY n=1 Tax=Chitinophaga pinensis (strain ATCC 43595 / DSM 2588 / LMG 13176 / NBRC 15968 / NCIMB 11800 / UQM 2034) TaxID=485918 RepID=A0A979G278_CHIPD|nr:FGGY family carbohydrate kinase [Chitinophaga pinensis]ACU59424.1 carbohydrate kinase FGGY [Chitinophaga pinensis DSM 2588]
MRYTIGYDIGSSSVKAALLDVETGKCLATAISPAQEMPMLAPVAGWAEQDPEMWWQEVQHATKKLQQQHPFDGSAVAGIGIAYQMHGLVCVDKDQQVLRPSIIWCDSRAVEIGNEAFNSLGHNWSLQYLLNSPGNFTASKLRWVQQHEPEIYNRIHKVMLPGDFIAMRLTGEAATTISGLSEGIFWDFSGRQVSPVLLKHYNIDEKLLSAIVPTFGLQGKVSAQAAALLGIAAGTPVTYRAGDQPNNAFSLNVLKPGEAATTAGTSGVVYAVHDHIAFDEESRVNTFVHVNDSKEDPRNGVLMCLNGTGILNSWLRQATGNLDYNEMNTLAGKAPAGSRGLQIYPFGNGAERILSNKETGAVFNGLNFNIHSREHLLRAAQEGIVFALKYGMDIMTDMGLKIQRVRAGQANMFLSPLFREVFANTANVVIELYNTDGAQGAARAAGIGAGLYSEQDAFRGMECLATIEPDAPLQQQYAGIYDQWLQGLQRIIK